MLGEQLLEEDSTLLLLLVRHLQLVLNVLTRAVDLAGEKVGVVAKNVYRLPADFAQSLP